MTAKTKTPTLKGDDRLRSPVSLSTLEDPLYVAIRPGSEWVCAWAEVGNEQLYNLRRFQPVRPEELEELPGGAYWPETKDFGVRFFVDGDTNRVRQGQHILMKVRKVDRDRWIADESARMSARTPTKTDDAELASLKDEGEVRLKDMLPR
jgi:hypothetical protein